MGAGDGWSIEPEVGAGTTTDCSLAVVAVAVLGGDR